MVDFLRTTYEYKEVTLGNFGIPHNHEKTLNSLGAEGWELVSVASRPGYTCVYAYLKRKTYRFDSSLFSLPGGEPKRKISEAPSGHPVDCMCGKYWECMSPEMGTCTLPPDGWYCTLDAGHEGSCPTVPLP